MNGSIGNDVMNGNAGDDRMVGGDGDDSMFGGSGDDSLNSVDFVVDNDSLDGVMAPKTPAEVTQTPKRTVSLIEQEEAAGV
jgi:Ca2+-binding RTX toxin-like protein